MSLAIVIKGWRAGSEPDEWEYIHERLVAEVQMFRDGANGYELGGWLGSLSPPVIVMPQRVRVELAPLASILNARVRDKHAKQPATGQISKALLDLVDLTNLLECVGIEVPANLWEAMRTWLPRMNVKRDDVWASDWWTTAFASLALDEPAGYRRAAAFGHDESPVFVPHETFQFNMQGLLRHLIAATATKAPFDDIRPAWEDLLGNYELLEGARSLNTRTLLWIARVVFHRIGGHPVGEVAQRLHDSAWTLAGLTP